MVDQFAKATVGAVTSAGVAEVTVRAAVASGSANYYFYGCSTSGSGVLAKRGIL